MAALSKKRWQDLTYRDKQSRISKELWKDADYRANYSPNHFKEMAGKLWANPATRIMHREKALRQWEDPEFADRVRQTMVRINRRRLKENPNLMNELTQKARISLKRKWRDPLYKERVVKSKILGFVGGLLKNNQEVTPSVYETKRTNNGLPNIQNALKYFDDFQEIVEQARERYNHRVVIVKFLRKREDVYDLTVDGTHNFALASGVFVHNSVDGDAPAAMRYTECRLAAIADELLSDIDKDTVDFTPNFDETLEEPVVLPSRLPNLLVNGSSGIAVGMATNIPPHNLSEIVDAVVKVISEPDVSIKDLMKIVKGPDFPTGAVICGRGGIKEAYEKGRGLLKVHAKAAVETQKNGKESIIITEIPYQVNK